MATAQPDARSRAVLAGRLGSRSGTLESIPLQSLPPAVLLAACNKLKAMLLKCNYWLCDINYCETMLRHPLHRLCGCSHGVLAQQGMIFVMYITV